ncbi:hypothetical protein [Columbia Basin potato purple top phytoplasma]|uniref:3-bisphosphoglycerate-independent phosphoglycerate mutase n=1 Tax=Columbia Basin potato purple top phytoplasma TaxID=307134 RepID=A0ABT5LCF4_9MOLU|nr:3-bisphosphoglycerate-independent phosphoglycerate mutase [Columbia Basin potato purple top phytoplasma]
MGFSADSGVHISHLNHFKTLLDLIKMHQLEQKKTYLHVFIPDGRDTDPYFRQSLYSTNFELLFSIRFWMLVGNISI